MRRPTEDLPKPTGESGLKAADKMRSTPSQNTTSPIHRPLRGVVRGRVIVTVGVKNL